MKKWLPLFIGIFLALQLSAQNYNGQWKGQFTDKSTSFVGWGGDRCDYVLEIECSGKNVTGYSYTYFNEGGKRFYTICRLKGTLNKASKYIEVTEVERTKTNVPNTIRNCFQIHRLTFYQQGEDQTLEGTWVPAPNQEGDCGYGTTNLTRRVLQKNSSLAKNSVTNLNKPVFKPTVKQPETLKEKNTPPPVVKTIPKQIIIPPVTKNTPPVVRNNPVDTEATRIKTPLIVKTEELIKQVPTINYEKRNNTLLKTIEIENEKFRVDLYDNGEVDGDSISLFFNGKVLLAHKRLSEKAITLTLKVDDTRDMNELIMYAENLGEIPPNTALMVVTDGDNRYEVRISSDLQKSGVIRFVHKPKPGQ